MVAYAPSVGATGPAGPEGPTELGWHNVVSDYGAAGDGVTDDGPAIQAAFDAAAAEAVALGVSSGNPVYFPPGKYLWNDTLVWKAHPIVGVSENAVQCFWGGGSGTGPAIDGSAYSQGQPMRGMQFRGGTPNIWVLKGNVDVWDTFQHCFWSETTVAAIKTAMVINFHIGPHVRWNLGAGAGVWLNHGNAGARSFSISSFTLSEGSSIGTGLIRMTGTAGSSNLTISIRDGRIEANSDNWPGTSQLILIDGTWSTIPASILLDSLACQIGTQTPAQPPIIRKDAGVDNACLPVVTHINCSFSGFAQGSWMAGTFSWGTIDPLPTYQRRNPEGF